MTDEESLEMFGWQSALKVNALLEFTYVMYHEALGLCAIGHGGMQQAKYEAIRKAKEAAETYSARSKDLAAFALLKHQTLPELAAFYRGGFPSVADKIDEIITSLKD